MVVGPCAPTKHWLFYPALMKGYILLYSKFRTDQNTHAYTCITMMHKTEMITNVQVSAVPLSFNAPVANVSASVWTAVMGFETAWMEVMRGAAVSFQSILTVAC